jgi:hypothetical protein
MLFCYRVWFHYSGDESFARCVLIDASCVDDAAEQFSSRDDVAGAVVDGYENLDRQGADA